MSAWRSALERAGRRLRLHAMIVGSSAILVLLILVSTPRCTTLSAWIAPMVLAASLVALGEALHLLFDAALLRLAMSFDRETAGLEAIDRTLAGMGLRTKPERSPSLDERLTGTRRIRRRSYAALTVALLLLLALSLIAETGQIRC